MKTYRLVIDGRLFPVADDHELARLKRLIVAAVRRNGGFVTLGGPGGEPVEVLVTTGTRVTVECAAQPEAEPPAHAESPGRGENPDGREDFSRYTVDELTFDADLAF